MKKTEFKNLKTKKIEELKKLVRPKKLEITKTLAKIAGGQEKNLKKARNLKKELAQMLTIIKEMEIVENLKSVAKNGERLEAGAKPSSEKV